MLVYSVLWPYWMFYSDGCLSTYSAEWDKGHIKRTRQHRTIKAWSRLEAWFRKDRRKERFLFEMKCHSVSESNTDSWQGTTKKLRAMLHNLLHTLPGKVTEIECLSILCVGDASPQECGSLPLPVRFNFPSGYFTLTAEKLSLEESGKHQRGMRGISAFRFSSTTPSPLALFTLDASAQPASWVFSFLNAAQQ